MLALPKHICYEQFKTMAPTGEELEKQAAALRESNPGNRAAK